MRKKMSVLLIFISMLCFSAASGAKTYKVAILEITSANLYENLFIALGEETGNVFQTKVYPIARATYMIENNLVDIQAPRIKGKDEAYNAALKFDFAAESISKIPFVLYTNKNKPLDVDNLRSGNSKGYKIEVFGPNVYQFGFRAIVSNKPMPSFRVLSAGRIDGYISAQDTGDEVLKSLKLTNIRRQLWDLFDISITLQKGQAGGKLDKIISEGIKKLKAKGKLDQIMSGIEDHSKYVDWQP